MRSSPSRPWLAPVVAGLLPFFSPSAAARAQAPRLPPFRPQTIDAGVGIGYGLAIADVNGDAKLDILLADKNVIAWYQNPGWEKRIVAEKLTDLDHVCIAARDLDGDGKSEVAAGAGWNPGDTVGSGSVHYLLPPANRLEKWAPIKLHHEPTVHRMRWAKDAAGRLDLIVSPLHGRGNKNGEGEGIKLLLYRRPADPAQPWTTELLDGDLHITHNLEPLQWDADPEDEVLLAAKEGVFLLDRREGKWTRTAVGGSRPGEPAHRGASEVRSGLLADGRRLIATVEPFHGNEVCLYTPPGAGAGLWDRKVIDTSLVEGHAVAVGDVAGAGGVQVLVGWRKKDAAGKVGIYYYAPADAAGSRWERSFLDDNGMACEDIALGDLNSDGRLDVIAAGRDTHNLKVYWNER